MGKRVPEKPVLHPVVNVPSVPEDFLHDMGVSPDVEFWKETMQC
jgi:hypothetical protein